MTVTRPNEVVSLFKVQYQYSYISLYCTVSKRHEIQIYCIFEGPPNSMARLIWFSHETLKFYKYSTGINIFYQNISVILQLLRQFREFSLIVLFNHRRSGDNVRPARKPKSVIMKSLSSRAKQWSFQFIQLGHMRVCIILKRIQWCVHDTP